MTVGQPSTVRLSLHLLKSDLSRVKSVGELCPSFDVVRAFLLRLCKIERQQY